MFVGHAESVWMRRARAIARFVGWMAVGFAAMAVIDWLFL